MLKYDVFNTVREVVDFITAFERCGWDVSMPQEAQVKGYVRALRHMAYASGDTVGMGQGYLIITSLGGVYTASGRMVAEGVMDMLANGIAMRRMYRVTVYDTNMYPYSVRDITA